MQVITIIKINPKQPLCLPLSFRFVTGEKMEHFDNQLKSNSLCQQLFQMEIYKVAVFLLLFFTTASTTQNYFTGLTIDDALLTQTSTAITDLLNTLKANLDCQPRQRYELNGWNLRGYRWLEQTYQRREFKGVRGFGGYFGGHPQLVCQNSQRGGVGSLLYQKVLCVSNLLQRVRNYLLQYNNVILGDQNVINGSNNIVIGSRNSLTGNNDWVFASDYQSSTVQHGVLILGVYLIELTEINLIPNDPSQVIHCIKQEQSNQHFSKFWSNTQKKRRFCF